MKSVLAYPGNMAHAQQVARALDEVAALEAFVTTYAFRRDGELAALLRRVPHRLAGRLERQLARRAIDQVTPDKVHTFAFWELVRTTAAIVGAGPRLTDLAWDQMSHSFDAAVASRFVRRAQAVHAFEYTALATFTRAKKDGVATILHLPSLDSRHFENIQQREKRNFSELTGTSDRYFDAKFSRRYERRQTEIALADIIITNSSLTARSHIEAGAAPSKIYVVPLGAPPVVPEIKLATNSRAAPLNVIWAGSFSLRKGAHYLLDAWRRLNGGSSAVLNVYGRNGLPDRLLASRTEGISFHGSVPQSRLFAAYETADILVFPTLSDGFGMVVAEAFAHGLPVITTDQAGAADLVTIENGWIVPAADARALADALRWCLDNREQLQEMRVHALEAARRRQWSDFRRDLIDSLEISLRQAGYSPVFERQLD
jgi:glycosyltransferase involved in cell wall biosynthesis